MHEKMPGHVRVQTEPNIPGFFDTSKQNNKKKQEIKKETNSNVLCMDKKMPGDVRVQTEPNIPCNFNILNQNFSKNKINLKTTCRSFILGSKQNNKNNKLKVFESRKEPVFQILN